MGKILKIVVAIIFVLGIVGFVMIAGAEQDTPEMASAVSFMVNLAIVLLVATIAIAVILSLLALVKNPAALKKTLLGLVIFAVLLGISFVIASETEVLGANGESLLKAGSVSKWSGTGLHFSLILLAIGGILFVVDLVKGLIKS